MKEWLRKLCGKIVNYTGIDGVLHLLLCYLVIVTCGLIDWIPGLMIACFLSIFKECHDYSYRDKSAKYNFGHMVHDLLFDAIGIALGVAICLLLK